MALKPGDRLGPYLLQERLGSGGFGSVWRAIRSGSLVPIPVAVKIGHELQSDAEHGADAVERLLAEARTWVSASGHRNVVPVQDVLRVQVQDGPEMVDHSLHPLVALMRRFLSGDAVKGQRFRSESAAY